MRRSKRGGQWRKRYARQRVNDEGKEAVAIWGYVIFEDGESKALGHATQEGDFRKKSNHAEARWVTQHLSKLVSNLRSRRGVKAVEFDVTLDPCHDCRIGPLFQIRNSVLKNSASPDQINIYVFVDVRNRMKFDYYLDLKEEGFVTAELKPDDS